MTAVQSHRNRAKAHNAVHAPNEQSKAKRAARALHQQTGDARSEIGDEVWHDMVSTAAYFRAVARGFESGSTDDDWYEAEAELREQLAGAEGGIEPVPGAIAGPAGIKPKSE